MSSMRSWSALEPSRPAIFWLIASILRGLAPEAALVSPVATATMAADFVSATNRMPSGPKASGPIDLKAGLPSLKSAVQWEARAMGAARPMARSVASRCGERRFMAISCGWDAGQPRRVLGDCIMGESCRARRVAEDWWGPAAARSPWNQQTGHAAARPCRVSRESARSLRGSPEVGLVFGFAAFALGFPVGGTGVVTARGLNFALDRVAADFAAVLGGEFVSVELARRGERDFVPADFAVFNGSVAG